MDWMTRDGKASVLRDAKVQWGNPRFSPDGEKLALDVYDGKQSEIWVYEWARDTMTQITFDPGNDAVPAWTPDGRRIVFTSDRAKTGIYNLYWVNADGSGDVTRLADSSELQFPLSWHPSGRFLAFHQGQFLHDVWDLMILPIDGDAKRGPSPGKPTVFLGTPAVEAYPEFSPDGRWIAYVSREGVIAPEVYVRPFPGPGGKWRISTEGGVFPHWSQTAHELLFTNQGKVWFAPYTATGDAFRAGKPQLWAPTEFRDNGLNYPYDIHPDGKRLALTAVQERVGVQDKVVFISNFFDYVKKVVPGK